MRRKAIILGPDSTQRVLDKLNQPSAFYGKGYYPALAESVADQRGARIDDFEAAYELMSDEEGGEQ